MLIRPRKLTRGDRIAVVTPSWGGPGTFPERYAAGKLQLQEAFGVEVIEMPHTLAPADWVKHNPAARARDVMDAFADSSISGIIASIGGDDSIRLLPYIDLDVIHNNPKVFLGFSDTTALHFACHAAGLVSFYGPSIMAGIAENGGMHSLTQNSLRKTLFESAPVGVIEANTEGWTTEHLSWADPALQSQRRKLQPPSPPRILQGEGIATGHLLGGCAEVLEMLKGTQWWPPRSSWHNAILVYETSEDSPPADFIRYWFRNYAAQGILKSLAGILLARPDPGKNPDYRQQIESAIMDVLTEEGLTNLPVLSGLDFGHTQPMLTLPLGAPAQINCATATLAIME